MMFMFIRKADAETEAGAMPTKELIDQMQDYNERAVRAGTMKSGDGLLPSSRGARVSFKSGKPTVIDGPFAETKELVAGFSVMEFPTLADAIEWAKQWPPLDGHGNVQLEIRQIITAEDLNFSEEQIERVKKLREMGAQQQ